MLKRLFCLLPFLAAALVTARDTPRNWLEVRSPAFTVITDANEKQGRRIAEQFERMRAILAEAYPQVESDPESPVVVLAVKDKQQFRLLEPGTYLSKGSLRLHGMFLRNSDKNYILMRLDSEGGNPYPIVYHEYTHLVLSQAGEWMPLWLNEGLAEFYERTEIYDADVFLGGASQHHLMLLRQEKLLPLATLFTVDERSPYYLEQKKGSVFYAEAWALTHYLRLKDYEEKSSKVQQYTKLVSEGVDPVVAGIRAFGDLKKLQKSLEAYIEQRSFNHFETKNFARIDASELQAKSIPAIEAEALEADFLACNGRLEDARSLLKHVMEKDPTNALAKETAGFVDAAELKAAEDTLRKAVGLDPSSAAARADLAMFMCKQGKNLDESRALQSAAVSLDSANVSYRMNLAKILITMGRPESALEVLRAAVGRTPQEIEGISLLLSEAERSAPERNLQADLRQHSTGTQQIRTEHAEPPDHGFVSQGPHRFLVGVLKGVHCETPHLDMTVTSRTKTVTLYAENYFKVQFTALFAQDKDLNPCEELENRPAKVEYVDSADSSDIPHLIAVELHR
jgi:tetratricopeptide (TPR) repeat protein